jgi:hypothetical protein
MIEDTHSVRDGCSDDRWTDAAKCADRQGRANDEYEYAIAARAEVSD